MGFNDFFKTRYFLTYLILGVIVLGSLTALFFVTGFTGSALLDNYSVLENNYPKIFPFVFVGIVALFLAFAIFILVRSIKARNSKKV